MAVVPDRRKGLSGIRELEAGPLQADVRKTERGGQEGRDDGGEEDTVSPGENEKVLITG